MLKLMGKTKKFFMLNISLNVSLHGFYAMSTFETNEPGHEISNNVEQPANA